MVEDNVVPIGGASGGSRGGASGTPKGKPKRNRDWMIRFYKKTGKKLTQKAATELSPILLFNTSEEVVAQRLFQAEHLASNRQRLLTCEVERFEGARGWMPFPKDLLNKSRSEEMDKRIEEAAKELERETDEPL